MEFLVLGPIEVAGTDGPRPVHGRKELAVLAYLLAHAGRSVPADELVWAVWGEDAPPSAHKSLQVRLSRLRADLNPGGPPIERVGAGYRLGVDAADLDAERFERLITEAARGSSADAAATYERALALVRGRPYADVADLDALQSELRRLEGLRVSAVEGRARALLELGRHADALPELDRAVENEPLHEGLAALHMRALYRGGRQADALDAYRRLAGRLDDLGLEPSEELRELERRMLLQDPDLAAPAPAAPPHTNIGEALTSFVGRRAELQTVRDAIVAHRLVTLTGPGGVGKTRLAVEAARTVLADFPDGVWVVELSAVRDPTHLPGAVAGTIGVAGRGLDPGGAVGALGLVVDHVRDRRMLLILDNCEHLAAGAGRLAERLLSAAHGVRILATTRMRLGAAGEAIVDVDALSADEAVELFAARARSSCRGFVLDDEMRPQVAALCEALDRLPLALELAAPRVRALPVADIAARLDDRFRLLAGARASGDARGRTLQGVVEWSHELLSADERVAFRRLAVFRSPFTLAAAEEVAAGEPISAAQIPDLLTALVDRSMVRASRGYRMLETLRAFGMERLREAGEHDDLADSHARFCARRARGAVRRVWAVGGVDDLEPARADLSAAAHHALRAGQPDRALPLTSALAALAFRLGDLELARRRLDAALALPGGHPADTLAALRLLASLLLLEGRLERGSEAAEAAQLLADQLGDEAEHDRSRAMVGLALLLARDVDGAMTAFHGMEARFAARGEVWIAGFVAGWTGYVALIRGELEVARERSRRAIDAFDRCHDLWSLLSACVNLGRAAISLGDYDDAAAAYERALAAAGDRIGDRVVPLLHDLGVVEVRRGNLARAVELWSRCAECADRDMGTSSGWVLLTARGLRWYPLMAAGHLARARGDDDEAARRYRDAQDLLADVEREARDPIGLHSAIAVTLLLRSRLAEDEGRGADATRLARLGLARARLAGDQRLIARALDALAGGLSLEGDPEQAAEMLGRAAALREAAGGPLPAPEQGDVDRVVARVRDQLGDGFDAAVGRGREPLAV